MENTIPAVTLNSTLFVRLSPSIPPHPGHIFLLKDPNQPKQQSDMPKSKKKLGKKLRHVDWALRRCLSNFHSPSFSLLLSLTCNTTFVMRALIASIDVLSCWAASWKYHSTRPPFVITAKKSNISPFSSLSTSTEGLFCCCRVKASTCCWLLSCRH